MKKIIALMCVFVLSSAAGAFAKGTVAEQMSAALEKAVRSAAPQYSAQAQEVMKRYNALIKYEEWTHTQPYHEQSYDNTVTPFVQELMRAHNKLKDANPQEALRIAKEIASGKFDIPAFIDRFSYGWGDCAEQDAYAAYLRSACRN